MPRSLKLGFNWLLVAAWMSLIFFASTDALSSHRTSRFIGPLLRWFDPGVQDETIRQAQYVVRKCAHLTEYGILALLLLNALRTGRGGADRQWCRRRAWAAFWLAVLYAASDEFHQSFVASRDGRLRDVLIDATGAGAALLCWWQFHRFRRRQRNKLPGESKKLISPTSPRSAQQLHPAPEE